MHPKSPKFVPTEAEAALVGQMVSSFGGTVRLPGSKSITNRALLVAGLASGTSQIHNLLDCDDSRYMIDALTELGVDIKVGDGEPGDPDGINTGVTGVTEVTGAGGPFPVKDGTFYLGNAGTTTRFLTAALAASDGTYRVDGDDRMRARPIGDLLRGLNVLGAKVRAASNCPPVDIEPATLLGGPINMSGRISSQFTSAVLMVSPLARRQVSLRVEGELVSRPYLDLTVQCMRDFGAKVLIYDKTDDGQPRFEVIPGRGYLARDFVVEGDASAASYFYAAAAISGGTVRVEGVGKESRQGDLRCVEVLAEMGCRVNKEENAVMVTGGILRGVDCNCSDIPDTVPTLAVVGMFARGRTRLRGVAHLRHKESDRIAALASELGRLGGTVRELKDGLEIDGTSGTDVELHGADVHPWGDHRIAMALSIAGLLVPGVAIKEPQVVNKSYPGFFQALASLGASVTFALKGGDSVKVGTNGGPS